MHTGTRINTERPLTLIRTVNAGDKDYIESAKLAAVRSAVYGPYELEDNP